VITRQTMITVLQATVTLGRQQDLPQRDPTWPAGASLARPSWLTRPSADLVSRLLVN